MLLHPLFRNHMNSSPESIAIADRPDRIDEQPVIRSTTVIAKNNCRPVVAVDRDIDRPCYPDLRRLDLVPRNAGPLSCDTSRNLPALFLISRSGSRSRRTGSVSSMLSVSCHWATRLSSPPSLS